MEEILTLESKQTECFVYIQVDMDRSSMTPKPVPPPKPLAKFTGQQVSDSCEKDESAVARTSSDSNSDDQIYSKISKNEDDRRRHLLLKNNKTGKDDSETIAIKLPITVPPVASPSKPPLLPKPNTSLHKPLHLQTKPPGLRPAVPKRPDQCEKEEIFQNISIMSSKPETSKKVREVTPLNLKAPVANLDELECWYEKKVTLQPSPVRPPRSPKIKNFVEGPFEKLDVKPELPIKKKWLLMGADRENAIKRSLSLGRSENTMFLHDDNKSRSLGRNLGLNEQLATLIDPKISPVPPPRRRNKSEEIPRVFKELSLPSSHKIPVYAAVNYEMKKNRRFKSEQLESSKLGGEIDEVFLNEVEGRLVLGHVDSEKSNWNVPNQMEQTSHLSESFIGTATNIVQTKTAHNVNVSDTLGSDERNYSSQFPDSISQETKMASPSANETCEVKDMQCSSSNCEQVSLKILENEDTLRKVDLGSTVHFPSPVPSSLHPHVQRDGELNINGNQKFVLHPSRVDMSSQMTKSEVSCPIIDPEAVQPILKVNTSELHRLMSDDNIFSQMQCSDNINDATNKKETCDITNNELILSSKQPLESFTTTVNHESSNDLQWNDNDSNKIDVEYKCDITNLNYSPLLLCGNTNASDLVIMEGVVESNSEPVLNAPSTPKPNLMNLFRRQSWSSSKDTTPSPECKHSSWAGKHKNSAHQHWCDEGDLSNGVLADSDTGSSDNTAKLSQEDVNSVRNKISAFFEFGSMGKGSQKHNKERKVRSSSQFYSEDESVEQNLRQVHVISTDNAEEHSVTINSNKGEEDSESDNEDYQRNVTDTVTEQQRQERKVFLIAQELMTSEKEFVDVLKLLNIHFPEAVNSGGTAHNPVISKSEFIKIINSLPQLQRLNEDLLRDLENRIKNWSTLPKIADVIVKKGPFLKLYSSYIQNFESQCNLLDECCQKYPRFAKIVKEFEALPRCRKLNIKHFMLKPVQRIPQYRLLLEDYLRHLDIASPDYQDTKEALRIVRDVADHANRSIKLGDHLRKLIELQSQLSNYEIIKPGRQFVKDGELFKLSRKGRHPRFFILLNDCLLYTSKSNTSLLRVHNELSLNGMKVSLPQVEDYRCEFSIISITRSFTLAASSTEERADWISALENAIKDHTERQLSFHLSPKSSLVSQSFKLGQQAPVWIQDSRVTMCQSCTTQFTVMFRRHHCRACGKVVCGVCSDNRAPLRYMRFHAARVCEECHDMLLQEFENPKENMLQIIMNETGQVDQKDTLESMRNLFKKSAAIGKKKVLLQKKDIPQRLKEVAANDSGSQMSGWLQRRGRRSWKRLWFVLKEQVLYVYKASEDVVALESIPVLGYRVEPMTERHFQIYEGIDAKLVFQLAHSGQLPLVFHADSEHMANRWMQAMQEATVLM